MEAVPPLVYPADALPSVCELLRNVPLRELAGAVYEVECGVCAITRLERKDSV